MVRVDCPGDGSGSSDEVEATKQIDWIVAQQTDGFWTVWSTESFRGVKRPSEPGGGHFTGASHKGDMIVGSGFSWQKKDLQYHIQALQHKVLYLEKLLGM